MAVKLRNRTNIGKSLDRYERAICLILADNKCEACGTTHNLSWAHIVERGRKALRWDRNNSLILCNKKQGDAEQSCHYQLDHMMTDRMRYRFVNKLRPDVYNILDHQIGLKFELTTPQMLQLLEMKKEELKELKDGRI